MINFKSIKYKNFLSAGNTFTEVQLNKSPSTLVVGNNGSGKSTMTDAISFGLFGKAHRNINKVQLVNSINNKDCVVEVEFLIGKSAFKIVRGIKPVIFEIYQNGTLINQESNSRDYQKYLELNILKMNHKSFHQIVVLGSSSFVPFMQLPAHHRREVIEDLLDINIFSKMNNIMREKLARNKEHIKDLQYQIDLMKEKLTLQRKYITEVTKVNKSKERDLDADIADIDSEIDALQKENDILLNDIENSDIEYTKSIADTRKLEKDALNYASQFKVQIKDIVKESKFYSENDTCSTCTQNITNEVKETKLIELKKRSKLLNAAIVDVDKKIVEYNDQLVLLNEKLTYENNTKMTITNNITSINRLLKSKGTKQKASNALESADSDIGKATVILQTLQEELDGYMDDKAELNIQRSYYSACIEMLKDTGIKTKIIKEYLPVMNTIVNKYLQVLDFFVDFHIDENFNETIRSRYRDHFSYASFSEGEKMKIDLSLLFAWRQIAKMKNSAATDLLILDETFDSSLDQDGVENLTKIMETLNEGTNTFIISHKGDLLDGKFKSRIEFEKVKNFSVIKEITLA